MIALATLEDLKEMDALRRNNQEAVGFVPMSKWEWHVEKRPNTLIVMRESGELTGYVYWTPGLPVAHIQQLVVREDVRRWERGTNLVNNAINIMNHPCRYGVTCRCRADLEATLFWESLGFDLIRQEISGRRGAVLRYYKELQPALFYLGIYLPDKFKGGGQRKGFKLLPDRTDRQ